MRASLCALALAASALLAPAQSAPPGLGDTPAALHLAEVLNAPTGTAPDWEEQRGKVVVLEFFGTWCGPCVASVPKINALVRSLDPAKYSWWLLADQPTEALQEFLAKTEVVPPVLIDEDSRTTTGFAPNQYPLAVVIGPDGRIAARLHPLHLDAERLASILAGERVSSPYVAPEIAPDLGWDRTATADGMADGTLAQLLLRRSPAARSASTVDAEHGRIVGDGLELKDLVGLAYGAESDHVELSGFADAPRYRISVRAADGALDTARTMLQQALTTSFGATAEVSTFEQERVVLERIPGSANRPTPDDSPRGGGTWSDDGTVALRGANMAFLARMVAMQAFGADTRTSLDLTGLPGAYRIEFRHDPEDPATFAAAFQKMGLRFEQRIVERRKVRYTSTSTRR